MSDSGIPNAVNDDLRGKSELDIFKFFVDNEIILQMVRETNRYAEQQIKEKITNESIITHSRLNDWTETNIEEMHVFLGILLWMGLDKKPSLSYYWSRLPLYNSGASKYMSRNRFELLLRMWYFTNNEDCPPGNRLHKIQYLVKYLVSKYQLVLVPGDKICIDETMIPFRGRLKFRQYIKGKRHKFGIKIFKLCVTGGYTHNMKIYCGKEELNDEGPVADRVVMELTNSLLNAGRTLYTDN